MTLRQTNGTPRVSLRLGRAHVPATRCVAFHYARVATLRRPLQSRKITPHNVCRGDHNVFEENLRLAKRSSAQNTMIFINGGNNIILLLNQKYYGLLIRQPSAATFPNKGRLLVRLCRTNGSVKLLRFAQRKVCFANV